MSTANVTLEIVMPVPELSPQCVVKLIGDIGATSLGGYVELTSQYGKGAKFLGSLIQIGSTKFTLIWNNEETKMKIFPVKWQTNYAMAEDFCVTVTGLTSGDTAMFKSVDDAKEWLSNLSSIEQLKLNVKAPGFNDCAVMFLAKAE